MTWMQTYKGHRMDFAKMDPAAIDLEDIAHALSLICRFNGHCRDFYSVAQHSVYVSQLVHPDNRLRGLLHDSPEAYMGDKVSPLKRLLPDFDRIEEIMACVIADRFNLGFLVDADIKRAYMEMLALEGRDLMGADLAAWGLPEPTAKIKIVPWKPELAERYFLEAFQTYTGEYAAAMLTSYAVPPL